jgi:serine/threonine protein kinase
VLQPGDRLDQFDIIAPLGQGGWGQSYLARDRTTGERVVLKLPGATVNAPEEEARFRREALILSRLCHPNIQRLARAVVERNAPYLALEYLEGRSLREWLESDTPPTPAEAVNVATQIAAAMAYAHARGVYHRDLKPENIIVLPDGMVKVIDFGSARMVGLRRLTFRLRGETSGTPDYMAPEQVTGQRGDARTDIYALGVILYEMLAGRVPFEGDNPNAVMFQQLNATPPPPSRFRPDVPPALEAIVMRALRKRPGERYQSAEEMLRDLQALAVGGAPENAGAKRAEQRSWPARLAQRLRRS